MAANPMTSKFLMVLLAFSTVSANIPNTYSGALCLQTLHPWLVIKMWPTTPPSDSSSNAET
jgi:purine-cytosine permease-like protein